MGFLPALVDKAIEEKGTLFFAGQCCKSNIFILPQWVGIVGKNNGIISLERLENRVPLICVASFFIISLDMIYQCRYWKLMAE